MTIATPILPPQETVTFQPNSGNRGAQNRDGVRGTVSRSSRQRATTQPKKHSMRSSPPTCFTRRVSTRTQRQDQLIQGTRTTLSSEQVSRTASRKGARFGTELNTGTIGLAQA